MAKNLLIVESPAKAKTINKYLGKDFTVLASYGHVRDLVPKEGAVDPEHGFAMRYDLIDKNEKHVEAIAKAAKGADDIFLATDPDREGEAISWHIAEILKERDLLKDKSLQRVVFTEITPRAIKEAMAQPRASCSSDAQPKPTVLVERFLNADCASCWAEPPAVAAAGRDALVLDWIVPGTQGEDAPLSAAATPDALERLRSLGREVPQRSDTFVSSLPTLPTTALLRDWLQHPPDGCRLVQYDDLRAWIIELQGPESPCQPPLYLGACTRMHAVVPREMGC